MNLKENFFLLKTLNQHLESMVDSQAQYFCWPCLVISGMVEPGNNHDNEKLVLSNLKRKTRINEDIIQQNINKMYPINQPEDAKSAE